MNKHKDCIVWVLVKDKIIVKHAKNTNAWLGSLSQGNPQQGGHAALF